MMMMMMMLILLLRRLCTCSTCLHGNGNGDDGWQVVTGGPSLGVIVAHTNYVSGI